MPASNSAPECIPSPYYHVPLADAVASHPDWRWVSHDMPFSDSLSGTLKLRITAKTPIFTRAAGEAKSSDFYRQGSRYAIPGASVRGSVRNVLRIVTSGRIGPLCATAPHVRKPRKTEGKLDTYLPAEHVTAGDWADTVFGVVPGESEDERASTGLRGRVAFTAFVDPDSTNALPEVSTVLGSPKAGYVPNYWTLDSKREKQGVRGWKRYAVRGDGFAPDPPRSPSAKMDVRFRPLPAETQFDGTMTFHNLRPTELGALLWVLLWGGSVEDRLKPHPSRRHSIGMAKPYGFGSCVIELLGCAFALWVTERTPTAVSEQILSNAIAAFESSLLQDWQQTASITELLALTDSGRQPGDLNCLAYPELAWFQDFKNEGKVLRRYSDVVAGINPTPPPASSSTSSTATSSVPRRLNDLKVGDIVSGTVRAEGRKPSHVFIDFGFKGKHQDGFLHVSEVASHYVKDLEKELPSETEVMVRVIAKERVKGNVQVKCSMKNVAQKP